MSWFAKSLVNSLVGGGGDDDDNNDRRSQSPPPPSQELPPPPSQELPPPTASEEPGTPNRGVKEDISELTKTLTRQFWGVASFLAPPPSAAGDPDQPPDSAAVAGSGNADALATGIRTDLAEIGGKFRSGISMLSQTKAVTGISKIAASLLELGLEDGGHGAAAERSDVVGVSEEVVMFVRDLAMNEETWLDFPLPPDDDSDDFVMSDAQEEHALAIERLVPRLAALRLGLCPSHMSEERFWTIYFVLLLPTLSVLDAELLSTPQIVEVRAFLLQDSQRTSKAGPENPETEASTMKQDVPTIPDEELRGAAGVLNDVTPPQILSEELISVPLTEVETVKHPVQISEVTVVDKAVIEEEPLKLAKNVNLDENKNLLNQPYDDEDADDWLEDETGEDGNIGNVVISLEQEEDVSFSDLEDDDK